MYRLVVGGAGSHPDSLAQHPELHIQMRGLLHDVGAREIVAAASQQLDQRRLVLDDEHHRLLHHVPSATGRLAAGTRSVNVEPTPVQVNLPAPIVNVQTGADLGKMQFAYKVLRRDEMGRIAEASLTEV